jgi:hypothetical protein
MYVYFYTWWVSKEQPKHVVQNNNKLNFSVHVVAMSVTADLQTTFHIKCLSSMKQLRTKVTFLPQTVQHSPPLDGKKEPFAYLPYFNFTCYMNFASRRAAIISKFWHNYITSARGTTWHHLLSLRVCHVGITKCRKLKLTALGILQRHTVRTKFGENRLQVSVAKMADTKGAVPHLALRWNVAWNGELNVQ